MRRNDIVEAGSPCRGVMLKRSVVEEGSTRQKTKLSQVYVHHAGEGGVHTSAINFSDLRFTV